MTVINNPFGLVNNLYQIFYIIFYIFFSLSDQLLYNFIQYNIDNHCWHQHSMLLGYTLFGLGSLIKDGGSVSTIPGSQVWTVLLTLNAYKQWRVSTPLVPLGDVISLTKRRREERRADVITVCPRLSGRNERTIQAGRLYI